MSEWVRACVCVSVTLYLYVKDLVGTIATTVFAQSLSVFTCKLWMTRGGTLLILGHRVKGQGQLWNSMYKTLWALYVKDLVGTIATIVIAQSLSIFTCKLWMTRGGTLLILGHRVKGQGQLWNSMCKTLWAR